MRETNLDKIAMKEKFFIYRKNPYFFNDIKDLALTLLIFTIFGIILHILH